MGGDRTGCCATWPKPCAYHEGWHDAMDSLPERRPVMGDLDAAEGHTPGPWHVGSEGGQVFWVAGVGPHVVYAAAAVSEPGSAQADAALIAMAPDLLAEVQALRKRVARAEAEAKAARALRRRIDKAWADAGYVVVGKDQWAAAEAVVEAARDADLKARAVVLDDDGWHMFAAHLRRIGVAVDAYDALAAPPTDRGADG